MNWQGWLDKWKLTAVRLNAGFAELEFKPGDADRDSAWDLYVELLTRITTQPLPDEDGDEETALSSIYSLFGLTRSTLKRDGGRQATEFAKIAIVVLNQVVRPFTAHWHKRLLAGDFDDAEACRQFRSELAELQVELRKYTRMLADMAGVEDLSNLEAD